MICGTAKFIDSSTNKIWTNQERQERFCLYMPGSKGFKRYACLLQCFFPICYIEWEQILSFFASAKR